jgi:hypothetical protein
VIDADQKIRLWQSLLDADQNSRYWRAMTLRFIRRERAAKIFLAIVSSATVAGWGFWRETGWVWQGLSVISAIVSVALPVYDVPRLVESMVELNDKWSQLINDYEEMWTSRNSISDADYQEGMKKAKTIEAELSKKATKLPHDDDELGTKTYNEVLQERQLVAGLKVGEQA